LKYAIKNILLALGREKAYFECQILCSRKENDLKRKYSLKLEVEIVSRTKSNNNLTNTLVKQEAKHMPDFLGNVRSNLKL
jgi:hypothetical protein